MVTIKGVRDPGVDLLRADSAPQRRALDQKKGRVKKMHGTYMSLISHTLTLAVDAAATAAGPDAAQATRGANAQELASDDGNTDHLENVTKMLGSEDGWQTPCIAQTVGRVATRDQLDFYSFARGGLTK